MADTTEEKRQMDPQQMPCSRESLRPLSFYSYGEPMYGSCKGVRFRIARIEREEETLLQMHLWPEPLAFARTDPSLIEKEEQPCTEEGLTRLWEILCARVLEKKREEKA